MDKTQRYETTRYLLPASDEAPKTKKWKDIIDLEGSMRDFIRRDKDTQDVLYESIANDDEKILYSENIYDEFRNEGFTDSEIAKAFIEVAKKLKATGWADYKMWFEDYQYNLGFEKSSKKNGDDRNGMVREFPD